MIQINDNDQPIEVAQKLVTGTKIVTLGPLSRSVRKAVTGEDSEEAEEDMFSLEEIKEIIDYLTVYYEAHMKHIRMVKQMDDLISRQVAMEMLMAQNVIMDGSEYHNGFNAGVNMAQEVIRNLSPVQQQITHEQAIDYLNKTGWMPVHDRILTESKIVPPVHGEWIDTETSYADGVKQKFQCSVCKRLSPRPLGDFCRWCGADMRGGEE